VRYTAEFRGGDNGELSWEWCVIDEDIGFCGAAILFGLTEGEAKESAEKMNREESISDYTTRY